MNCTDKVEKKIIMESMINSNISLNDADEKLLQTQKLVKEILADLVEEKNTMNEDLKGVVLNINEKLLKTNEMIKKSKDFLFEIIGELKKTNMSEIGLEKRYNKIFLAILRN